MTDACAACQPLPRTSRIKTVGAWVGLIFFCPCHLPLTIAGLLLILTGAGLPIAPSWGRPLLYAVFGASFVGFLMIVLRMVSRRREQVRDREREHEGHAAQMSNPKPSG